MLKCKIVRRSVKLQIYKTLIRPVITYGSETWTLPKSDRNSLIIFERKILRKIYGLIQEGDIWRFRDNEELNISINVKDVVKFIKAQTIRWLGHVKGIEVGANAKKDDGRKTVHRQKKRKTSFEMDG